MARPTKGDVKLVVRAQVYDELEANDIAHAINLLNANAGCELSHTQLLVVLARYYLKGKANAIR